MRVHRQPLPFLCARQKGSELITVLFPDVVPESSGQVVTINHLEVASRLNPFVILSPEYPGRELKKLRFYHRPLTQQEGK